MTPIIWSPRIPEAGAAKREGIATWGLLTCVHGPQHLPAGVCSLIRNGPNSTRNRSRTEGPATADNVSEDSRAIRVNRVVGSIGPAERTALSTSTCPLPFSFACLASPAARLSQATGYSPPRAPPSRLLDIVDKRCHCKYTERSASST